MYNFFFLQLCKSVSKLQATILRNKYNINVINFNVLLLLFYIHYEAFVIHKL